MVISRSGLVSVAALRCEFAFPAVWMSVPVWPRGRSWLVLLLLVRRHARGPDARRVLRQQPAPGPHHRSAAARLKVPRDTEPVERLGRQRAGTIVGDSLEVCRGIAVARPGDLRAGQPNTQH